MTHAWITAARPLHLLAVDQHLLLLVLVAGGLAGGLVLALSLAALARRRSWSYLLVTLALSTLLVRALVGILGMDGLLGTTAHHLVEHGLDLLTVALLLGAVYAARTVDRVEGSKA